LALLNPERKRPLLLTDDHARIRRWGHVGLRHNDAERRSCGRAPQPDRRHAGDSTANGSAARGTETPSRVLGARGI